MPAERSIRIHYEQAVYGSFPFWDRGYALLARSPGCRPDWLAAFQTACQRFGERPHDVTTADGLFALPLDDGTRMVVGVSGQGTDDHGRPGALAFHALFLSPDDDRKLGGSPFPLAGCFQRHWEPQTQVLPSETAILAVSDAATSSPSIGDRARRIASSLAAGHRVAIESSEPIDALAREVWNALPERVRRRARLATWAFGNGNRFDLVALPRLAGVALDASYVDPDRLDTADHSAPAPARRPRLRPFALFAASVLLAAAAIALTRPKPPAPEPSRAALTPSTPGQPPLRNEPKVPPPDLANYPSFDTDPESKQQVLSSLVEFAERFGVIEPGAASAHDDPASLMLRIAERLRYQGPFLSDADRARLASETGPGLARALDWDAQIQRFAADRPLPSHFARGPLRWQLDTLTWSFHLDPDARLAPAEIPLVLANALAVDGPIRPNPLADRYPILNDYARFLASLPAR